IRDDLVTGVQTCALPIWPRGHRAAEKRDEIAPLHSITSSARARSVGGTLRPSNLAVSVLMTSSNLSAWATGRSAGLAPLRIRPRSEERRVGKERIARGG